MPAPASGKIGLASIFAGPICSRYASIGIEIAMVVHPYGCGD
jgi:hypothetical protein